MDTLVAMGSMASFVWSVYALFAMTGAQLEGKYRRRDGIYARILF